MQQFVKNMDNSLRIKEGQDSIYMEIILIVIQLDNWNRTQKTKTKPEFCLQRKLHQTPSV